MTSRLIKSIKLFNVDHTIYTITKDIRDTVEERNKQGILINIKNTFESILLSAIGVRSLRNPGRVNAIYFISERRYKMPPNLDKLMKFLRISYEYIEIGSIARDINSYIRSYISNKKVAANEVIEALILRELADSRNLLLIGDITRSNWLLGIFNQIYMKSMDLLPLTKIYKTQTKKLISRLHILQYTKGTDPDEKWINFKNMVKLQDDMVIDAILEGIISSKTDEEIYEDISQSTENITIEKVSQIRKIFEQSYFKRNTPLTLL